MYGLLVRTFDSIAEICAVWTAPVRNVERHLRQNPPFSQLFLCLSRAWLGKLIAFSIQVAPKRRCSHHHSIVQVNRLTNVVEVLDMRLKAAEDLVLRQTIRLCPLRENLAQRVHRAHDGLRERIGDIDVVWIVDESTPPYICRETPLVTSVSIFPMVCPEPVLVK